jgi:hypothetical protein
MHVSSLSLIEIWGKIIKNTVKQVANNGEIRGISMLWKENEEIIFQYVNDTSLSMVGEEKNVDKTVDLQGIDSYWCQHWSSIEEKTWHTSRKSHDPNQVD